MEDLDRNPCWDGDEPPETPALDWVIYRVIPVLIFVAAWYFLAHLLVAVWS